MTRTLGFWILLALATLQTSVALVPGTLGYQGVLRQTTGGPVADGDYEIAFRLYDVPTEGTPIWQETLTVGVNDGTFNAILGKVTALNLSFDRTYWLGMSVGGGPELAPRPEFTSSPYAFHAVIADSALAAPLTQGDGDWTIAGNNMYSAVSGNVGVGTTSPAERLDVAGNVHASGTLRSGGSITINGANDRITTSSGTISFDNENIVTTGKATIGPNNTNTGAEAFVVGKYNAATGEDAFVAGEQNTAAGYCTAVSGGEANTCTSGAERSTICGGGSNTVTRGYQTIVGGWGNYLENWYEMAFGQNVRLTQPYTVAFFEGTTWSGKVWINRDADAALLGHPFVVGTGTSNGNAAYVSSGGVWTNGSSREFKKNLQAVDGDALLSAISQMDITTWEFKNSDERHFGPMAEDFVRLFDVGTRRDDGTRENQYLAAGDVAGVALAGVKELARRNHELEQTVEELKRRILALEGSR